MKKILLALLIVCSSVTAYAVTEEPPSVVFITLEEAAAPDVDDSSLYLEAGRNDDNGPAIEVISPQSGNPLQGPIPILVRFVTGNGAQIDLSTRVQ